MLRTAGDFQGLSIAAADGDIGSVRDLCFRRSHVDHPIPGRGHATRSSRRWPRASVSVQGDPSLRSGRDVTGYYIAARDGDIGHVDDFLVDDRAWAIRYLIVDTRNWWPGKKVALRQLDRFPGPRGPATRGDQGGAGIRCEPTLRARRRDPALRALRPTEGLGPTEVLGVGGAVSR
jgi:hypothetical protein